MREGEVKGRTRNHRKGGGVVTGKSGEYVFVIILIIQLKCLKANSYVFYFIAMRLVCRCETQETTIRKQFEYKRTK